MQPFRKRLTYANVVSSLALILAIGGTSAFAASQLAKNSVGARQLKKNAVTAAKLKAGAVTGAKVADGSLTGADVNAKTLGTVPNAEHASSADQASGLTTLPSGRSESGFFQIGTITFPASPESAIQGNVSFQQPLAAPIPHGKSEIIFLSLQPNATCPGPGQAAPGHLCVYDTLEAGLRSPGAMFVNGFTAGKEATAQYGFDIEAVVEPSGGLVIGSWTVTAP